MADTGVSPPQSMKCKNSATCKSYKVPTTSLGVCLSQYTDNCVSVTDTTKTVIIIITISIDYYWILILISI